MTVFLAQRTVFEERRGDLLDEERIAFGLGCYQRADLFRQYRHTERSQGHLGRLLLGERLQRQTLVVAAVAEAMLVARSIRADEHGTRSGYRLGEKAQQLFGGLVDPVQILDDDDDRLPFRLAQ